MSILDSFYYTHIKNRSEQTLLTAELNRIEREKQDELRMLNTERQRFRSKYTRRFKSNSFINQSSDPVLFNSQHVFGRNSEFKSVTSNSSVDFKAIQLLLFTNGEVDIGKILCLYLLAVHKTETLNPPRNRVKMKKYISKDFSPLEKLIERSKKRSISKMEEKLYGLLPLYVLEVDNSRGNLSSIDDQEYVINDGRLASRLLVNEKIFELIYTVIVALEDANADKLLLLTETAKDHNSLEKIFESNNIQEFLRMLKMYPIITSCESFVLTPPFKNFATDLEIRTPTRNLENLIVHIRKNVLQLPTRKSAFACGVNEVLSLQEVPKETEKSKSKRKLMSQSSVGIFKTMSDDQSPDFRNVGSKRDSTSSRRNSSLSEDESKMFGRHQKKNFIAKNIEAAGQYKRIEYDTDDDVPKPRRLSNDSRRSSGSSTGRRRSSGNVIKLNVQQMYGTANDLLEKEEEEIKSSDVDDIILKKSSSIRNISLDMDTVRSQPTHISLSFESSDSSVPVTPKPENLVHNHPSTPSRRKSSSDSDEKKLYIKQTTCPACMEKWKESLPSPKTPRIIKKQVLPPSEYTPLKTNSQNRISMLIDKELYKLNSYDRKYSSDSGGSRRSITRKEYSSPRLTMETQTVDLSKVDLAKIKQEIREKETQKKLENFLK